MNGAQHCPECGSKMSIKDTNHGRGMTFRIAECPCGERWETEESRSRRLPPATIPSRIQPGMAVHSRPPPPTAANPPVSTGGVGGGVSSGSDPVRNSGPISTLPDQTRARRKRRTTVEYDPRFDVEWNLTAKTGAKDAAQRAWEELGRPAFGASWKAWEQCAEWKQEWYHYPHVATWLRDGRYKQAPEARVKQAPQPTRIESFAKRQEDEVKARAIAARAKTAFGG